MPTIIIIAVISITAALLFYTAAAWWNWANKRLEFKHIVLFWFGLAGDMLGTAMMKSSVETVTYDLHTISGYTALVLMLIITAAGTLAIMQKNERVLTNFHKFGIPVWCIWTISWITGVVLGIQKF